MKDGSQPIADAFSRAKSACSGVDTSVLLLIAALCFVGVSAASVTIYALSLNPLAGGSASADGIVYVESQSLSTVNGSADAAVVTLAHGSRHRVECGVNSTLIGSNGAVVDRSATRTAWIPAGKRTTTTLDYPSDPDTSSYMLFDVTASDCSMLGWPMFGFNGTRAGTPRGVIPRIYGPAELAEEWSFSTPGSEALSGAPALDGERVYVGSDDDSLYAVHASNGSANWSYATGGDVSSAPAVVGGTAYAGSRDGSVYALDAANGTLEWSAATGGDVRSSPSVAGGTVYVGSDDDSVYALDAADGSVGWSTATGGNVTGKPAVVNGTAYVGSAGGSVYALDATDGSVEWSTATSGPVHSSPAVVNGTVYVGSDDGSVYALDAATGSVEWSTATSGAVRSSPAVVNGTVYVGSDDGSVYALDTTDGSQQWTAALGNAVRASPAVVNGTVYVGDEGGTVYTVDASTGAEQGSFAADGAVSSAPVVSNGTVYVASAGGRAYALRAGSEPVAWATYGLDATNARYHRGNGPTSSAAADWSYSTGGPVASAPVVANDTVYVGGTDGTVYALAESDGSARWTEPSVDAVHSAAAVSGDRLLVGSTDGSVYGLNAGDGSTAWTVGTGGEVRSPITLADGTAYVGSDDGSLYALDPTDGSKRWSVATGGRVRSAPAAANGTVYVGSRSRTLRALGATRGHRQWFHRTGTNLSGGPTVTNGTVLVGSAQNGSTSETVLDVDSTADWDRGTYDASSADGPNATLAGRLSMGYGNDSTAGTLTGYWRFDDSPAGTGGTVRDYSGYGNDGTTKNSADTSRDGVFDSGAVNVSRTNKSYVDFGNDSAVDLHGDNFTVSAWIKFGPQRFQDDPIVSLGNAQWKLRTDSNKYVSFYGGNGDMQANSGWQPDTTKWYHVVGRYDASRPKEASLWINGTREGADSSPTLSSSGKNLTVGRDPESSNYGSATVDELRLYDTALSNESIRQLYRYGRDGTFEGNYTRTYDATEKKEWRTFTANVTALPTGTELTATLEARDDTGTLVDSTTVSLSKGTNTVDLSLPESKRLDVTIDGNGTDPAETWRVESFGVESGEPLPPQATPLDYPGEWRGGTFDATSPDAAAFPVAGNLSLRYANGTADDDLQGFYRFDGSDTSGTRSINETLGSRAEWNAGAYDGASADAVNGSESGDLSLRYANGTGTDGLRGYYRFDRNRSAVAHKNLTVATAPEWDAGTYNGTTADGANATLSDRLTLTYANGTAGGSLNGYWRLDRNVSGSGGTVLDYSGENTHGSTYGSLSTGDPGALGTNAVTTGGTDDRVEVNHSSELSVSNEFAVSVWVKTTTFGESEHGKNQTAVVTKLNYSEKRGWGFIDDGDYRDKVLFRVLGGGNDYDTLVARSKVNDGNWHNLVGVYNGSAVELYLDGQHVATSSDVAFDTSAVDLGIGADRGGGREMDSGAADEVRVYNRSLSAEEVRELHRWGSDGTFEGHYARTYAGEDPGELEELEVDVAALPAAADANVTVKAVDETGTVVGSSTHSLSDTGVQTFALSLPNANDTRVEIRGTSTDPAASFAIDRVSLVSTEPEPGATTDYSGDRNDGTARGNVTSDVAGAFGTAAYDFDGNGDYVDLDQPDGLNLRGNATISAWVRTDAVAGANQTVVAKGESQYRLLKNDADQWAFATHDGTRHVVNASTTATAGEWVHLVGRVDTAATDELSLWVDGTEVDAASGGITANTYDVTVGRENETGGDYFDGRIDEVRIYDRALSDAEIRELYRYGGDGTHAGDYTRTFADRNPGNLAELEVAVDDLPTATSASVTVKAIDDGGSVVDASTHDLSGPGTQNFSLSLADANHTRVDVNGTTTDPAQSFDVDRVSLTGSKYVHGTATDYSGNGLDGTTSGQIATGATGTFNTTSFDFDGTDDEVDLGDPPALNVTGDLTVSAWVNTDVADAAEHSVVSKGDTQYGLRQNANDRWEFYVHDGTATAVTSNATVSTGTWVHLVGRYDASTGELRLWVNGTGQGTASVSGITANGAAVAVGNDTSEAGGHFDGRIDEVRIYDRALSDREVAALYRRGGDGAFDGTYSQYLDSGRRHTWSELVVNVTGLPASTTLEATVQAHNADGTINDTQTITLSAGSTTHSLSINSTEDAELWLNGTSTSITDTWAVENVTLVHNATTADGPTAAGGEVVALDDESGLLRWALDLDTDVTTAAAVDGDRAYVGLDNGTVLAVDATTGSVEWRYSAGTSAINATPAVVDETVYVGADDGSVYALDAATGAERWTYAANDSVRSAPTVINGTVYVGADDGDVRALR